MYKKRILSSKKENAIKTKKKLFKCATELFKKKGYYNVTVDEIVFTARVSKGTFYYYFKSKDQIIIEELKKYDNNYISFYNDLVKYGTVSEKIISFVENMYDFTVNKIGFDLLYVVYKTQLSHKSKKPFVIDIERPFYKYINRLIKEGQKANEFTDYISTEEITRMIMCNIMGVFYNWCLNGGDFDIITEGTFFFSQIIKSIRKK